MSTTSLKLQVMPIDEARAQAAMAAGQRLMDVGTLLARLFAAVFKTR